MARPTTREELKQYCLRQLGKPVIDINVDDAQLEDRIDDALEYFRDYHFDGSEKTFLKVQITATDITNEYVTIDEDILGVVNVFDIGDSVSTNNIFNLQYQLTLHDVFQLRNAASLTSYMMVKQHVALMQEMLVGKVPLRYNRHTDRVYLDMNWSKVTAGNYLIIEAYREIDPDTYPDLWADRWLSLYVTQLFKKQWGQNLKKFDGIQLPGGVTFTGQQLYDEAVAEIEKMETEMLNSFSLPVHDLMA